MAEGNRRPVMLEKVEKILWDVLLGTINQPDELPTLLQSAIEKIDMDELWTLSESDAKLFEAGKYIGALIPASYGSCSAIAPAFSPLPPLCTSSDSDMHMLMAAENQVGKVNDDISQGNKGWQEEEEEEDDNGNGNDNDNGNGNDNDNDNGGIALENGTRNPLAEQGPVLRMLNVSWRRLWKTDAMPGDDIRVWLAGEGNIDSQCIITAAAGNGNAHVLTEGAKFSKCCRCNLTVLFLAGCPQMTSVNPQHNGSKGDMLKEDKSNKTHPCALLDAASLLFL
jgi:hypothetical protein